MAIMGGDPSQDAWVSGLLAGAGLREISQVLGLSRKRQEKTSGAMPNAATMLQGNMGEVDKLMALSRLQAMMPKPMGMPMPGPMRPPGMPPMPGPMPGPMPPPMPGAPMPGMPPGLPPSPMGPGMPMRPPMPGPAPMPSPSPGGAMPMMLLQRMLAGAGGLV